MEATGAVGQSKDEEIEYLKAQISALRTTAATFDPTPRTSRSSYSRQPSARSQRSQMSARGSARMSARSSRSNISQCEGLMSARSQRSQATARSVRSTRSEQPMNSARSNYSARPTPRHAQKRLATQAAADAAAVADLM